MMSALEIPAYQAQDLMSTNVLCVYEGWSIERLADFFLSHDISGAPVISSDHQLIGMVSKSDIVKFENSDDNVKRRALSEYFRDYIDQEISREDLDRWCTNAQKNCTVHQIMSSHVISVDEQADIEEVVRLLVDCNIHRVFVTQDSTVTGVITTLDVLKRFKATNSQ